MVSICFEECNFVINEDYLHLALNYSVSISISGAKEVFNFASGNDFVLGWLHS